MKLCTGATAVCLAHLVSIAVSSERKLRRGRVPPITDPSTTYYFPSEEEPHEGTWLQWPHNFGWDRNHVQRYEESWIQLAEALHYTERVHIIAYNWGQRNRIRNRLVARGLDMSQIDFVLAPTDDVWVRDNGPIFVYNENDELMVEDWRFNGWGNKADWWFDDYIPIDVANFNGMEVIPVPMVNEGGSIEVDGLGTLMAKRSSILNNNRNRGWTQQDAEAYFRKYLEVTNFIWLDGTAGSDITDDHIDGTARFANGDTIVTHYRNDFVNPAEYDVLSSAQNAQGQPYKIVHLPLTQNSNIPGAGDYGIYINYYVANGVVIVPIFNDPNDAQAIQILGDLYEGRTMVPIDFTELYKDGGLVHCVTQQQPVGSRRRLQDA